MDNDKSKKNSGNKSSRQDPSYNNDRQAEKAGENRSGKEQSKKAKNK